MEAAQNHSVVADEQNSFGSDVNIVRFDLTGQSRLHATVVPEEFQGRSAAASRELES
jgi:hypothetical protein